MPSSTHGGPQGVGSGVLRAGRVAHPWEVRWRGLHDGGVERSDSLAPPSAEDWCLLRSVLGRRWHWRCGMDDAAGKWASRWMPALLG
jgi:hypothetical protein